MRFLGKRFDCVGGVCRRATVAWEQLGPLPSAGILLFLDGCQGGFLNAGRAGASPCFH